MKAPPIFYGANLHNTKKTTPVRIAYCQIQGDWNLTHVDISLYPHNYIRARSLIYRWMHTDGFLVKTKYLKDKRVLRLWRCIRVSRPGHTRFVKLGAKDRFGFKYLQANESVTYGPFFSTPRQYRKDWKQYFEERVRKEKNPYIHLLERPCLHPFDPYDADTAFIIYREL